MVLLTGATGYTGRYVADVLAASGTAVRCLVRPGSVAADLLPPGVETVMGDLAHPDSLTPALADVSAVIAASHIRFAPAIIKACQDANVGRVIFFSSTWRFSKVETPEVSAVVEGENAVEASGLDATLLRPTMIYGPGDDRNVSRLRDHVRRARLFPVFGTGEGAVQPVHVEDVARAAVAALDAPASVRQAYEIAGGDAMPYRQMVDVVCAAAGAMVIKLYIPMLFGVPLVRLYGVVSNSPKVTLDQVRRMDEDRDFDTSAAQRDLGFQPRSFAEGLRDAMQQNGEEVNPVWERSF